MNIEVLDSNGDVITLVTNSGNPERDTADYGGVSWRKWVMSDAERIKLLRATKINDTRNEERKRLIEINKGANLDPNVIRLLANSFTATGPGAGEWNRIKGISRYGKIKEDVLLTATEAELNAYNPRTDQGWPA